MSITAITAIKTAWQAYRTVEKRGLDLGRVCYEQRAKAEVVQGGTTFGHTLDILGVPRRTAYYWIRSYEISIGVREPAEPVKPKPTKSTTAKAPDAIEPIDAITDAVNFPPDSPDSSGPPAQAYAVPTVLTKPAKATKTPPTVHTLESHRAARRTILCSQIKAFFRPIKSRPDFKNILAALFNGICQDFGFELADLVEPVEPEVKVAS